MNDNTISNQFDEYILYFESKAKSSKDMTLDIQQYIQNLSNPKKSGSSHK
jgi:hypothetical protein